MWGRGPESWSVMSHMSHVLHHWPMDRWHMCTLWSRWTCAHMCWHVSAHVMCRYAGESLSLPSLARLHHCPPLLTPRATQSGSHSDLTKIMTTHSLSSAVAQPICCLTADMSLTLISVMAAYDSISLLRLELVIRTKDLRGHKRCKLRAFMTKYQLVQQSTVHLHRQELHNSTWQGSDDSRG